MRVVSKTGMITLLLALTCGPALADPCTLNFITHGTFHEVSPAPGRCLLFVDDTGGSYEITNPHGAWKDGMAGTLYGNFQTQSVCTAEPPVEICNFDADYSRNVVGTLVLLQFIECPGYVIRTGNQDYLIRNCEDFAGDLCDLANVGRRVKAEVMVDTGVSICLGLARSVVVDYEFLK